ncbi:hypothetical protein AKJ64_00625 [candidate division MSBL1 archaeon SCGC-AAA259E17]|uniref:Recombinase domain-containing protein n=1 Tax=candidate division MSBL1 archaeon SCGC-AAA259E17 TaxID=1698263 RepID=A0A133UGT5_9EURY|nr:hypothetical protein AKJ64_00625 [candidate division MSBL1 archaeon SCGC-AAA259E17]
MFLKVDERGIYKKVAEKVNQNHSSMLSEPLDSRKIKRILKNSVYIGKPKITGDMVEAEYDGHVTVSDPDLAYVTQDVFDRVQEKIRKIEEKHSSNGGTKVVEMKSLIKEFGLDTVKNNIPDIAVLCPDCGERMVKNGQKELGKDSNLKSHNWICKNKNCGRQRLAPNKKNLEKIRDTREKE